MLRLFHNQHETRLRCRNLRLAVAGSQANTRESLWERRNLGEFGLVSRRVTGSTRLLHAPGDETIVGLKRAVEISATTRRSITQPPITAHDPRHYADVTCRKCRTEDITARWQTRTCCALLCCRLDVRPCDRRAVVSRPALRHLCPGGKRHVCKCCFAATLQYHWSPVSS